MDIKYPDGPFCLCALEVPHPRLLGHKSAKKAFGKRVLLAALPKRALSLLSRFFLPCGSISQDFVVLGFIFHAFIFFFFSCCCLEGLGFFSVDVEGGDTYS